MKVGFGSMLKVNTIDEAWDYWYSWMDDAAREDGEAASSRDGDVIGEIINAVTVIKDPTRNFLKSPIRKLPFRYCVGELLWYLSGNPNLSAIQLYTNAWDRMSDDGKTVNSNYGYKIKYAVDSGYEFDQMEMCEEILRRDPNSRQAVIHIKEPREVIANPTKDLNCTVCLQFFVREGMLFMTTYMRSNDLWMGFPNDVFQFTCMQIYLAMKLNLRLGAYTHIAGSLHLYERDYLRSLENRKEEKSTDGATQDCSQGS